MSNPRTLRIILADDHFIVRSGLVALIDSEPDMEVVAQATDGAQAIEAYSRLQPDVLLVDLRMPVVGGNQVIETIRRDFPAAHILVLTAYNGDEDIHKSLASGACGYLLKSSTGDDLIPAIRTVAAGGRWIPRDVASRLAVRRDYGSLTQREIEVLREIARGRANKEIAGSLAISENTVKDHLKSILAKLQVAARTEAVTVAVQRGIIEL